MRYYLAILQAKKLAADFTIQVTGVTLDGSIVTTIECVRYQKEKKNLYAEVDGNWRFERSGKSSGWKRGRMLVKYIQP